MNLKKLNEIFGYVFFIVGALKILLLMLSFIQIVNTIFAITNGEGSNFEYYSTLATGIEILQVFLIVGSFIMIFLNKKRHPEVIIGYLYGLGACFLPTMRLSTLSIYFLSAECILYIKAGNKVRNNNAKYNYLHRISKDKIQDTEWFYSDKNEENKKINKEYQIEKLEELEDKEMMDNQELDDKNAETITIVLVLLIGIILLIFAVVLYKIMFSSSNNENINIIEKQESIRKIEY